MKQIKTIFVKSIFLLLFSIYGLNSAFAQVFTAPDAYCSTCQKKINNCICKSGSPSNKKTQSKTPASSSVSFEQQILMQIFAGMLQNTLQSTDEQKKEAAEANLVKQQRIAALQARQKKYNDSIAQVKHDKMMKEYKPLEGNEDVSFKKLDNTKPIVHFNCKITSFKGTFTIVKSNGKMIVVKEGDPINASIDLAPGDLLATGFNSRIKLHYGLEKGGHDVLLGQRSAIRITEAEDGTHEPTPLNERGNLYVTNNMVSEKIAETTEELITEGERQINKLKRKFYVRTPTCGLAVRGTEFMINVDSLGNSQVFVLDGIVDVTGDFEKNTITLTAGKFATVNSIGEITGVYLFKKEELKAWWKEE